MAHLYIRLMRKRLKAANVHQEKPTVLRRENGRLYYQDVSYGGSFPNHTMDLYLAEDPPRPRPTLFYVHGGGYTWGDKASNPDQTGYGWVFERFLQAGYGYPMPILQMGEAIRFLQAHPEYGICLDQVVFAGCSAGGQLVGQFCNLQTNPDYAAQVGMEPVLDGTCIRAVVFQSALLEMERFGDVDSREAARLFTRCGEAYFDIPRRWPNSPKIPQANVTRHVCERFPPCYISDGNFASFTDQARALGERCNMLGIPYELELTPYAQCRLPHGYEMVPTPEAAATLERVLLFLERL